MQSSQSKFASLIATSLFLCACGASNNANLSAADGTSAEALSGSSQATRAIRLKDKSSMCLDVKDVTDAVGADMQVWTCHFGVNQTFSLDESGLIHVFSDKCLAANASGQGQVVLATCSAADKSQQWQIQSNAIVAAASQSCLEVASSAADGTLVTTAACASSNSNQAWLIGTKVSSNAPASTTPTSTPSTSSPSTTSSSPSTPMASGAAKTLTTEPAVSMDTLSQKVPSRLKAQMSNIVNAAAQYNLQPQMLVAIAMEESTGGADGNAYSNGGGMFQFTDTGTWAEFGTNNPGDRQNDAVSVTAAAKYMAYLLNESGGSFSAALRAYNGPIGQGGNPSYISDIQSKMLGNF